jgi:hypothetical protein
MAAQDDRVSRATDGASIALLRRLRAGAEIPYVHRVDVCSAAPADLVANLIPAPGTDQMEDGYNSIWYFYCPKRYKNTRGKASGHRQRAIGTRGETRWHPEVRAKDVRGSEGGTFCTFSYGRMKDGSLERMGWCMVEYDFVDKQAAATAASNYVLCKVYRSSRAKGKPSSSSKSATSSCSKRKAGSGYPEARPAKLIHIQREQVQMQHDNSFTDYYPMPCYEHQHMDHTMFGHEEVHALQQPHAAAPEHNGEFVQTEYGQMPSQSQLAHINVDDWICCQEMFGGEEEHGLQQPSAEKEQAGEFIQIPCGLVLPVVAETTVEDLLGPETMSGECISLRPANTPLDDDFFVGVDPECLLGAQEEAGSRASSSPTPSWSMAPSSSTRPVAPVVAEASVEDLLGPEMMSGECISMPTESIPLEDDFFVGVDSECLFGAQEDARTRASSSYLPSWSMAPSSSAGCSTPVQEPLLWLPYLMCS